VMEPICWILII